MSVSSVVSVGEREMGNITVLGKYIGLRVLEEREGGRGNIEERN